MNKEQIALDFIQELREKGEWHNWIIDTQNEYIIDTADVCELAHEYTENECLSRGIEIDRQDIDWLDSEQADDIDTTYSEEAQAIFDRHYDLITNKLSI